MVFGSSSLPYYLGYVPEINGPISTTKDYLEYSKYKKAIQDDIDSKIYTSCQYSYTDKDKGIKTIKIKSNECIRTTVPIMLAGDYAYTVDSQVRDIDGSLHSAPSTKQNPLFVTSYQNKPYSSIKCKSKSECKIQMCGIKPTTLSNNAYVITSTNAKLQGKANSGAAYHTLISMKPLSVTIETENELYYSREGDSKSTVINKQVTFSSAGTETFEVHNNMSAVDYTVSVSEGKSSSADEEFLLPSYAGVVPMREGAVEVTDVKSVKYEEKEEDSRGNPEDSGGIPAGVIVVWVVIILVIAGIVTGIVLFCIYRKKKREAENAQDSPETKEENAAEP